MNRFKIPTCSQCRTSYQITDVHGPKVPMLLICGHDMCRNCIKFLYKKHKNISCKVCSVDTKIENESQIYNIPIHYFLVGKVWYFKFNKKQEINWSISNLKMTNLLEESSIKDKKFCGSCQKNAKYFCQQCSVSYCESCNDEVHMENQSMSQHDMDLLNNSDLTFPVESTCDRHLKIIDFICITCQLHMCSICAIEDHRQHDIQSLEKYHISSLQHFNECTSKGENLLKKLKLHKDEFNVKLQHSRLNKKNCEFEVHKLNIDMFMSYVVGNLQLAENNMFHVLNVAEFTTVNSVNKVIHQLNGFIDDLQSKLNTVDLLLKNNQYSSNVLYNTISDIENILHTTFYIAKKIRDKPSLTLDDNIVKLFQQFISCHIDTEDTYVLGYSPQTPPNYTLRSTISVNDDELPERRVSSTSTISTLSSNFSAPTSDVSKSSMFNYSSVKEITKNVTEPVVVTHINSPSDFYLQLEANVSIIKMIVNEVHRYAKTEQSTVENIEMNNLTYAVQVSTNQWFRGIVVDNKKEDDTDVYTVFCIDYGFTLTLTADRIRSVPASVFSIPPLAHNCTLYELKPSSTTGWSNDAYKLFRKLMTEKSGSFIMYPMEINGEQIEVDVIWNEFIYPLSIRDAMYYLGYGSSEGYLNRALYEQFINTMTLPEHKILEEGKEYVVTLSHFISLNEFFLHLVDEKDNLLNDVMKPLESIYKPTETNDTISYLLYTPQIGMAVAARYSIDGTWYRAKITHLPEPRMVTVFYIDYGNSETLPWNELRVLDKSFIKIPPLAIKASLAEIYPAINGIECNEWSGNAIATFIELLGDNNLIAFIHEVDDGINKVVLHNHTTRGKICVNSKLITLGHAMTFNPGLCEVHIQDKRKLTLKQKPLQINSRKREEFFSSGDTLAFTKKWSVIEDKVHTWKQTKLNENAPGIPMLITKIVSPSKITLKYSDYNLAELTERLNEVYTDRINRKTKLDWKVNDLCASFLQKFGNWYRGKILKVDTNKKSASVYFYDLDDVYQNISLNTLYTLEKKLAKEKCGILHCCMNNLVPLGSSDGKWPKFSCDRLIEELKKYPTVYFSKKGMKDNIHLGDLWIRSVETPKALEPICKRWINVNRFMIEQGFAISNKQDVKDDDSTSQLESETNSSCGDIEHCESVNCWLPPIPVTESQFKAKVTYVDTQCILYLQILDSEMSILLQQVLDELCCIYKDSKPEPINVKWVEGQMVIARYHLDGMWYRGTITKKEKNGKYTVQFLDYGNIESCAHEDLRSTLYMTDIPQLCIKGFFCTILPFTKNKKWPISTLDYIHYLLVEKECTVTVDMNKSSNTYAIKHLKYDSQPDFCQYLVASRYAYFEYMDTNLLNFNSPHENECVESDNQSAVSYNNVDDEEKIVSMLSAKHIDMNLLDYTHENVNIESDNQSLIAVNDEDDKEKIGSIQNTKHIDMNLLDYIHENVCVESTNQSECSTIAISIDYEEISNGQNEDTVVEEELPGFLKFCLKLNEVVEGSLCNVIGPTRMTLMIEKIGGVNVQTSKNEMQANMFSECGRLPVLDNIVAGTPVAVLHNVLWRRGTITDDCRSVYLVDSGIHIKLVKKNLRLCPPEYLELPMFAIDCQLANMTISENADAKDVIRQLSDLLTGINLKIVGINAFDDDVVGVELYNNTEQIAYQPLIDSQLLIPK